ncbi:hypothetical protein O181_005914 [Austropuccinia psidii MF-1]|uniref:Uncharacterized protein n=1 Tax=Austropuccinia psidii MF-1 TaxID=1389203 RepID=A0A9Q3BIE0_9BASI|nr:hypothetical protein [Austropuccinia psidii MF-1]
MSPVHHRKLKVPGNQPEDRTSVFLSRIPGFGQHGEGQDPQGNHAHTLIHLPSQQTPKNRGLDRYVSSSSTPLAGQRSVPMENGKTKVQPGFKLGRTWTKLTEDVS